MNIFCEELWKLGHKNLLLRCLVLYQVQWKFAKKEESYCLIKVDVIIWKLNRKTEIMKTKNLNKSWKFM